MPSIADFSCDASVEELLSRFNSTCSNVLNAVTRQCKTRSEPWIEDSFHSLGRCCRRAERKRKKDRLHVSFEILKDFFFKYQKAVKKVKCRHLSDIINKKCSRPKTLFNIINPSDCLVPGFLLHHLKNLYYFLIVKLGISKRKKESFKKKERIFQKERKNWE